MTYSMLILLVIAPLTGGMLSLLTQKTYKAPLKFLLAFSGSFLFTLCLTGLLPEIYQEDNPTRQGVFVLLGFLFQLSMEHFSKGVEHGHLHGHHHGNETWLPVFLALGFHAITEGIALGGIQFKNEETQIGMVLGIAIHEIPASFALGILLQSFQKKISIRLIFICLYSLFTLSGFITGKWMGEHVQPTWVPLGMAFITGVFLHISTTILFENSENHRYNRIKLIFITLGALLGLISSQL